MHTPDKYPGAPKRRSGGFSLIELMVTLTVAAILLAVAAPSFNDLMARSRMTDASRGLGDRLAIAMNVSESRPTTICVSSNGTSCAEGASWAGGYIVFTDEGELGTVDGTDAILERGAATKGSITVLSTLDIGGASFDAGLIHFEERAPAVDGAVRFTVCQSGQLPHQLVVNRIGSLRQSKGTTPCA